VESVKNEKFSRIDLLVYPLALNEATEPQKVEGSRHLAEAIFQHYQSITLQ
jgi:hypothetical protein